jgi:Tol biopolymer transport system component
MRIHRAILVVPVAAAMLVGACSSASPANSVPPSQSGFPASPSPSAPTPVLPDEPWIAYSTIVDTGMVTYLVRPNGTDAHQIMVDTPGEVKHPDWSPDGLRLAVSIDDSIWVTDADGSHAQLARGGGCCDFPAWSPDGTKLAFTGYSGESLGSKPRTSWIVVLDLATKQETTVVETERPLLVDVPRWSPDGNKLVVGVHEMDEEGFETGAAIAIVPASGGELRYLTEFTMFAYYPDWSWVTNTIVFDTETMVDQKTPNPSADTANLFTIQPDGSGLMQITDTAAGTRIIQPTWTPDGTSVIADFADIWIGVRIDPATGSLERFGECCVSHPRLRPTP